MTVREKTMAMGCPVEGPYFVGIKGEEKPRGKFDILEDARIFSDALLDSIPAGKVVEICDSRDYIERALYPAPRLHYQVFNTIKEWEFTEKVDGTNIRVIYDSQEDIGKPNNREITFGGRTDNAQLPAPLINYLHENISPKKMFDVFGEKKVIIFGEGYGGKIQSGSGYSPTQKFIVFDILVADKYWLTRKNVEEICTNLGLDVVPFIGLMTLEEAVEIVKKGFKSKIGDGSVEAEGLIGRTTFPVFDVNGKRLICKIKTRDF